MKKWMSSEPNAKAEMMDEPVENFSIVFNDGNMIMAWDKTMVAVPVKVK